ncbi:MAG: CARDB domain-containing protein [Eubacteriales bacterium]|nr:CARDB domain-containing protein [Eubacteriales bacterium]
MKVLKILSAGIAAMMVISMIVITALADSGLLTIDNENVYDGMNQSYSSGYAPVQSGDSVKIVLPLVPADAGNPVGISGDTITVTPGLGDTSSSPFVFSNYQKTVQLKTHTTKDGTSDAYLVNFDLALEPDRYQGSYTVILTVAYTTTEGEYVEQPFTVYAEVDGANAEPTQEPTQAPRAQPKLIVSSYSVDPKIVEAGQTFTVTAALKNTSEKYDVRNIKITYTGDGVNILPADNTNTQYIEEIGNGKSYDLTFDMQARLMSEPGIHTLTLNIEYEDSQTVSYSLTEEIRLEVTQPLNIEIDEPNIPAAANAGDTVNITLNIYNKGRSAVYNVMCSLEAQGLLPESSAFVGNMEPGSSGAADLYVFVGTLNMSASEEGGISTDSSSDERYGLTDGVITVVYEDEFGEEYTQEMTFTMDIQEPVITAGTTDDEEEEAPDTVSQWWLSVLIAGVIIAGIAVFLLMRKKRREKALGDDDGLD